MKDKLSGEIESPEKRNHYKTINCKQCQGKGKILGDWDCTACKGNKTVEELTEFGRFMDALYSINQERINLKNRAIEEGNSSLALASLILEGELKKLDKVIKTENH